MGIILTDEQKNVIKTFMKFLVNQENKYMIIHGAAGTGKTTMIKYMLSAISREYKLLKTLLSKNSPDEDFNVLLTATTNKAVAVLQELSGDDNEVKTIHSTLGLTLKTNYSSGKQSLAPTSKFTNIYNTILIVDEASMLDDDTVVFIDKAVQPGSKVVLIGDTFQLSPIQQKEPTMQKLVCPRAKMHKVLRHAGTILETATIFRDVVKTLEFQSIPLSDAVQQVDGPTFQQQVEAAFLDPRYNSSTAKILAWSNKRVQEYNQHIRKVKGLPDSPGVGEYVITNNPIITKGKMIPVDSEIKITHTGNTIDYFGVSGCNIIINDITQSFMPYNYNDAKQLMKAIAKKAKQKTTSPSERSKLWKTFYEIKEQWLDLRSPYASTVHKAQGSSYDKVFIDLSDIGRCNIPSDVARMLYVAISRAKEQVVLYGSLPVKYQERIAA